MRDERATNNVPAFTGGDETSRSVDENTALGVNLGDPVTATDEDETLDDDYMPIPRDTLTYSIDDGDAENVLLECILYTSKRVIPTLCAKC